MSGKPNLRPLTANERVALASLCALADEAKPLVINRAAARLGIDNTAFRKRVVALRRKGWVADGPAHREGYRLRIVERPANIELQRGYRPAAAAPKQHPDDKPATRKCLSCGEDFLSEGFGNRRCKRCKSSRATDSTWMGEIEVWPS